jgi:Phosphotransferase enzyme family
LIPLPPHDAKLPGIPIALNGEAMTAALNGALEDVTVLTSEPDYVRYRPGIYCRVRYRTEVVDEEGRRLRLPAHVALYPRFRSEKLARRHGLLNGSGSIQPRTAFLSELHGIAQLFPVDIGLPGLMVATSPEALSCRARSLGNKLSRDLLNSEVELVRYKPQKRAVLKYHHGQGPEGAIYGKLRKDRTGLSPRIAEAIQSAGVATPSVLGRLADIGMALQAAGSGVRLSEFRGSLDYERWMPSVASALVRLHEAEIEDLSPRAPETEVGELRTAAETAAAVLPEVGPRAKALAQRLAAELIGVDGAWTTIHGSFHDDQVLVGGPDVTLIDLDGMGMGNPLADVGHFLAYLSAEGAAEAYERFLGCYLTARSVIGTDHLVFEAASLLRWATLPFRELHPDWKEIVEERVLLAEARLDSHGSRA